MDYNVNVQSMIFNTRVGAVSWVRQTHLDTRSSDVIRPIVERDPNHQ